MEDIYYLIHVTNNPDCTNWKELKCCKFNIVDQFPGVYLSVITKYNIDREIIFPGKYVLIFSKKLLYQNNYHINLKDYNGIITENNTYYPWSLSKFININKNMCISGKSSMNEIIFHDNIDMKYCCSITMQITNLPRVSIENKEQPDMTKLPFFCFPFEDIYTGCNPQHRGSLKWYNIFSRVANIIDDNDEDIDNIDEIIKKIKENALYIYNNRNKQNINILYEYSSNKN
jgi:hypothetical protein